MYQSTSASRSKIQSLQIMSNHLNTNHVLVYPFWLVLLAIISPFFPLLSGFSGVVSTVLAAILSLEEVGQSIFCQKMFTWPNWDFEEICNLFFTFLRKQGKPELRGIAGRQTHSLMLFCKIIFIWGKKFKRSPYAGIVFFAPENNFFFSFFFWQRTFLFHPTLIELHIV